MFLSSFASSTLPQAAQRLDTAKPGQTSRRLSARLGVPAERLVLPRAHRHDVLDVLLLLHRPLLRKLHPLLLLLSRDDLGLLDLPLLLRLLRGELLVDVGVLGECRLDQLLLLLPVPRPLLLQPLRRQL